MKKHNPLRAVIYHNPKCSTSRAVLEILRDAGVELDIIDYLKHPLTRDQLADLAGKLGGVSGLLRTKEALAATLDLKNADDSTILSAIAEHPSLFNRPVVTSAKGTKVCRPAELVRTLF